MDQHVFVRLENGGIVTLQEGQRPSTSYVEQEQRLPNRRTSTDSYVIQGGTAPIHGGYEGELVILDEGESVMPHNEAGAQRVYEEEPVIPHDEAGTQSVFEGEPVILDDEEGTQRVVYIVQQEGMDMEGMQFTLVGDDGACGSTFALQTVATGDDGIAQVGNYIEMAQSDHTEMSNVQEMSGIETLSRVAAGQIADGKVIGNSETNPGSSIRVEENEQVHNEGTDAENVNFSFYCQNCGEAFEELEDLKQHLLDEHGAAEGETGQEDVLSLFPTCQLCSQTFVDAQQLEKHEKEHMCMSETNQQIARDTNPKKCNLENKPTFKCKFCSMFFVDRHELHKHVKHLHQSETSAGSDKTNMFKKCPYCHKLYVQRGNNKAMMNHIYSAHPGKSVEIESNSAVGETEMDCPVCGLKFVWQKSLIRHMKDRHPKLMAEKEEQIHSELGIPYVKSPGKRHRRSIKDVCEDPELMCCPNCPRKFIWEKSLKRHMQDNHDGDPVLGRVKKTPVVFCCPHCSLVSKYACAIRKHLERKHSEIVKGLDIIKLPLPTKDATAMMDIELKTVDKRPAEERLNLCPFIYRCPFCIYAAKLRSNLIRHLTSVKHGNIFSHEEIVEIGIHCFKVKQNIMNVNITEKIDGTSYKTLPKLSLKGEVLEIVMKKYEILKQRKLENKENGLDEVWNDEDYTDIDVDNIIELAEYESEESFDEDEIEIIDVNETIGTRETRQDQRNNNIEMNETDDNDGGGYSGVGDILDENENTDFVENASDTKKEITLKTNESQYKIRSLSNKELKEIESIKRDRYKNIQIRQDQGNEFELDSSMETNIEVDTDTVGDTTEMNQTDLEFVENTYCAKKKISTEANDMDKERSLVKKEEVHGIKNRKRDRNKRREARHDQRKKDIIQENEFESESTIEHESHDIEVDTSEMNKTSVITENSYNKKICLSKLKKLNETNGRKRDRNKTSIANEKSGEIVVSLRTRSKPPMKDTEQANMEFNETSRKKVLKKKFITTKKSDESEACLSNRSKAAETDFEQSLCGMDTHKDSVVCEVCRKELSNFSELKLHLSAHVNMKLSFRCNECGLQDFSFFNDMKTHMDNEHNIEYSKPGLTCLYMSVVKMNSKPVTTYDCPYCEMLFSQSSPLQQHVIMDHSECIQSALIKQEYGITRERGINNTIISAYNCQYCECFYHNITDIVKHMHVIHKDVDRSNKTVADSCVRKSSRKRKIPKWLEEETRAVSAKKSKQDKKLESDTCTSLKSSKAETASVSKRKKREPQNLPMDNTTTRFRKKKVETDVTEKVLDCASKLTSKTEKHQLERIVRETLKTQGKDNALGLSKSNRLAMTNDNQNKTNSGKMKQQDKSKRTTEIGLVCLKDQTEGKNSCPHCDFVAKRSSALAFHVKFKHSDIKIKEELVDSESEVQNERAAHLSPRKTNTCDSAFPVCTGFRKSEINEKGNALSDPAVELLKSKKRIKDRAIVETSVKSSIGDTLKVKEQKVTPSISLANTKICENESKESTYGLEQDFGDNDKDDGEFHEEEEDLEYGDSDDDYKPEPDTDGDSDIEELYDDDVGYSISVKLECPYCQSELFSSLPLLEQHVEKKHPKEVTSFSISDAKTKVELDGIVKSSNLVHTCNYCRKTFLSKAHVRAHVRNRHKQKLAAKLKRKLEKLSRNEGAPSMNDSECKEFYKCKFCTTVVDSSRQVLSHIKKQHPLEKDVHPDEIEKYERRDEDTIHDVYICPYCETKSKWKRCISRHITNSHAQVTEYDEIIHEREIIQHKSHNLFQCVYCSWQYERKVDVLSHIEEAHSDQPNVTKDDLFEVEIADKVENSFQCPFCDLKSKYKRCVIRHVSRTHKSKKGFAKSDVICLSTKKSRKSANEGLVYMCLFCDGESRWKDRIVRHVEIQHPDIEDFNPETIPSEHRTLSVLSLDDEGVLDNEEDTDFENYKCTYCDAISDTKEGVLQHTLENHPNKTIELHRVEKAIWNEVYPSGDLAYKCPVCDSGSKWKRTIVRHVKTAHPELKKFQVELCKADLTLNVSDSMHVCRLCNELFRSIRAADAHNLHVHGNGEKAVIESVSNPHKLVNVFRCVYCDYSSGLRKAVVTHVAAQHPEVNNFQAKNVICEIVPETQLSGIGGYLCPYCDTVNHWKKSIVRHIRTMHPKERNDVDIPFNANVSMKSGGRSARKSSKQINCLRCGISCRSMEKMRKHFLNKHQKLAKNFLDKKNTEFSYESMDGKPLDHVCVLCSAKYMWKKSLLVHMKRRHGDIFEVYQALDHVVDIAASAAGPTVEQRNDSTTSKPGIVNTESVTVESRCGECKLVFKSPWAVNIHRRLKHVKHCRRRFQCSKCNLSFSSQVLYLQHKIRSHRNKNVTTIQCTVPGCTFRCKFHQVLQNHYSNCHKLKKPRSTGFTEANRCEICTMILPNATQLRKHVSLHEKRRRVKFQCGSCGEQFLSRVLRDIHIESFHFDKAEMCDICGTLCTSSNIKKHMKLHIGDHVQDVQCPYCNTVVIKRLLNRHVLHEHQSILNCTCTICMSADTRTGYSCTKCAKSFCQKTMMFVHNQLLHPQERQSAKLFFCEACPDLTFLTKRMKDAHCHEHHKKKTAEVPKRVVSVSSTSTYNDGDPTTHVIHIGQDEGKQYLPKLSESSMNAVIKELLLVEKGLANPFKCLLCGRSFSKSKYIKLHIRRAHVRDEDQPYRCKVCGSGFVRLTEFRKHSRSHSDFRPYKCHYCDRAFKQQANLRDHFRVHTNSKDFACYICKTEFRQRGGLTSHVVFHDTLKPFKCMYCQKGFTTRGELSRHMQKYQDETEVSEKNYPCHICEDSFPHYPILLKHIDSHNPDKPFQCVPCKQKFANYVAMYFHKVKEEHFLLEEIQEGMKDLQSRGRKFRAKRNSARVIPPEIHIVGNQQVTETIYISQPDAYPEDETNVKPVELIIEGFGEDGVVRVQENEPEHEELLSIAKQLTELSGFTESEYYSNKRNAHQEEDEIMKNMLDADEDVLASLSKQAASNKLQIDETNRPRKIFEQTVTDVENDIQEEDYEYMTEIRNNVIADGQAANNEDYQYVVETNDQRAPSGTLPTNMEELVSLVAQSSASNNSEQVMAYQSEDGTVIYVCLPEDDSIKTEEVVIEESESAVVEGHNEDMVHETTTYADTEFKEGAPDVVSNETTEHVYEGALEAVASNHDTIGNTGAAVSEGEAMETDAVDFIHIPTVELTADSDGAELESRQMDTSSFDIVQREQGMTGTSHLQSIETGALQTGQEFDTCIQGSVVTSEQIVQHFVTNIQDPVDSSDQMGQQFVSTIQGPVETDEQMGHQFIVRDQGSVITSEQEILHIVGSQMESNVVAEVTNQDYTILEPQYDDSVITIQPQEETSTVEVTESQEDLLHRSQLAQHLTGTIQPFSERTRIQTHLIVTEQGLQSIGTARTNVKEEIDPCDNISQSLITVGEVAMTATDETGVDEPVVDSGTVQNISVSKPVDSYVEGEESLVEYQIDESRFIKEELLDTEYSNLSEKDREVMFVSDNIYTYSQLDKKFICLHCGAKIGTFKNLKYHIRRHGPESSRTHACYFCSKKFVTKNELKRHLYTHTGERNYECKECGKRFIQPGHLQEHTRLHTGHKPFKCEECIATFITKSQLVLHWSRIHSNNEIPCSQCEKVFKTRIDLRRHRGLEHSGRVTNTAKASATKEEGGEHVCDICGQSFCKKAALKRHLEKHNLENIDEADKVVEQYACAECGASFKSKYYVKDHVKIVHSNEKNHKCELCGKAFKTITLLRRHTNNTHVSDDGRTKWHCDICNKSLGSKYAYGYHMGAKH